MRNCALYKISMPWHNTRRHQAIEYDTSQSLILIRNITTTAISTITYLRNLLPETCFTTAASSSMPSSSAPSGLKHLKGSSDRMGTQTKADILLAWMDGVMDAISHRYLKTMVLGIYEDPAKPNVLLESYSFSFNYGNQGDPQDGGGGGIVFTINGIRVPASSTKEQVMQQTTALLRRLLVLTQSLNVLPPTTYLTMRLYYYEDVTPLDYEPACFQDGGDAPKLAFATKIERIAVGNVITQYHGLQLSVITRAEDTLTDQNPPIPTLPAVEAEIQGESDYTPSPSLSVALPEETQGIIHPPPMVTADLPSDQGRGSATRDVPIVSMEEVEDDIPSTQQLISQFKRDCQPSGQGKFTGHATEEAKTHKATHILAMESPARPGSSGANINPSIKTNVDEVVVMACPCKVQIPDGRLIACDTCHHWCHLSCAGFGDGDTLPEVFYCPGCTTPLNGVSASMVQWVARMRRFVMVMASEEGQGQSNHHLAKQFGYSVADTKRMVDYCLKEGYLIPFVCQGDGGAGGKKRRRMRKGWRVQREDAERVSWFQRQWLSPFIYSRPQVLALMSGSFAAVNAMTAGQESQLPETQGVPDEMDESRPGVKRRKVSRPASMDIRGCSSAEG